MDLIGCCRSCTATPCRRGRWAYASPSPHMTSLPAVRMKAGAGQIGGQRWRDAPILDIGGAPQIVIVKPLHRGAGEQLSLGKALVRGMPHAAVQGGILDCRCARRSARRQVGTKGWSFSIEQRDVYLGLKSATTRYNHQFAELDAHNYVDDLRIARSLAYISRGLRRYLAPALSGALIPR